MMIVVMQTDRGPRYYLGMLDGRPRFGDKIDAVRMNDDLAETVVRQLGQGWKRECALMDENIRFGSKPKEAHAL